MRQPHVNGGASAASPERAGESPTVARGAVRLCPSEPLLIIEGGKDHTVTWAIANAPYKRPKRNEAVTEIKKIPSRGHSLTIEAAGRGRRHSARVRGAFRVGRALT
jgi:hypothetical protein